jgi:hypothetical protein
LTAFDAAADACAGTLFVDGAERSFWGPMPPSCSSVVSYSLEALEHEDNKLEVLDWLAQPCVVARGFLADPPAFLASCLDGECKKLLLKLFRTHPGASALKMGDVAQYALNKGLRVLVGPGAVGPDDADAFGRCRGAFDLAHVARDPSAWALYVRGYEALGRNAEKLLAQPALLQRVVDAPLEALFPVACAPRKLQDVSFAASPNKELAEAAQAQRAWRELRRLAAYGNHVTAADVVGEYGEAVLQQLHKHDVFSKLTAYAQAYDSRMFPLPTPPTSLSGLAVVDRYEERNLEPSTFRAGQNAGFTTWLAARTGLCRRCEPRDRCFAVHEVHGLVYVTGAAAGDTATTLHGGAVSGAGLTFVCQLPADLAHAVLEPRSLTAVGLYAQSPHAPELSWNRQSLERALSFLAPGGTLYVWGSFDKLKRMLL